VSLGATTGFANEAERDRAVHYGKCLVDIPKTHQFGSLGTRLWQRWSTFRFEDDHLKLERIERFTDCPMFFDALRKELATLEASERQVLVYLHGYNVTFEEAALRAAQVGFDLKIEGATVFFSWPSCGKVGGYFADADRIAESEKAITEFLINMANGAGANRIHIVAHSMGSRGLGQHSATGDPNHERIFLPATGKNRSSPHSGSGTGANRSPTHR
jgi:esterase/lipase superfamily enzyme